MLLACIVLAVSVWSARARELVLVHSIWRHGDRTPTFTWPTDENGPDTWPVEPEQLSHFGMDQHFVLGKLIKERYQSTGFLDEFYDNKQIYVRTSHKDRTVMSALSNLAGMYHNGRPGITIPDNSEWPDRWRPIALYNKPEAEDNVLLLSAECKSLDEYNMKVLIDEPDFKKFWEDNKEFLTWVNEQCGLPIYFGSLRNDVFKGIYHAVKDTMLIYKIHNKVFPKWMSDENFERLYGISVFQWWRYFEDQTVSRLVGGGDAYDQFGRVNLYESSYYKEKYDYLSIMHYDRKSFSKNGRDTMVAKERPMTAVIGRMKDFSTVDLRKINKLYGCNGGFPGKPVPVFTPAPPKPVTRPPEPWTPWKPVQPQVVTNNRSCRDKATLCWRWVNRCQSPFFDQIMREFCARTCGFCHSGDSTIPKTW